MHPLHFFYLGVVQTQRNQMRTSPHLMRKACLSVYASLQQFKCAICVSAQHYPKYYPCLINLYNFIKNSFFVYLIYFLFLFDFNKQFLLIKLLSSNDELNFRKQKKRNVSFAAPASSASIQGNFISYKLQVYQQFMQIRQQQLALIHLMVQEILSLYPQLKFLLSKLWMSELKERTSSWILLVEDR